MLVYGDHRERLNARDGLIGLEQERSRVLAMPSGLDRHSALTGLFIDLAAITQGVADAQFAQDGRDGSWPDERLLMRQLVDLGLMSTAKAYEESVQMTADARSSKSA